MELTFLWKETDYEQINELMNSLSGGGQCCSDNKTEKGQGVPGVGNHSLESDQGGSSWKCDL